MKIEFSAKPCLLLETVELLYAYINNIPAQELSGDGPYCIPSWNLQQIMNDCCAGLSSQRSILEYYFASTPILDDSGSCTCLARNILFDTLDFSGETLEEAGRALHESWKVTLEKRLRPNRIAKYGLVYSIFPEPEYTPLASYMERLLVSPAYQQKLLEAFAGYDASVDRLIALIAPVAQKLEQHLEPWVEKAAPLMDQWQECLHQPDLQEYLRKRFCINQEMVYGVIKFCLHFLDSKCSVGHIESDGSMRLYMGLDISVYPAEKQELESWEYRALRLLGSPARMRMFQATLNKPMTTREISQELNMHLGAVSRDVVNLFDARLLIAASSEGKTRYCANLDAYDTLLKHMHAVKTKQT